MKAYLISFILLLVHCTAFAQGGFLRLNIGYDFAVAGQTYQSSSSKYEKGGFGEGVLLMGGIGCMFNKTTGIDIGCGYLVGNKFTIYDPNSGIILNTHVSSLLLQPTLRLAINNNKDISPFIRVGASLAISPKGTLEYPGSNGYLSNNVKTDINYNDGAGMSCAIGLAIKSSQNIFFTLEFNVMAMSLYETFSTGSANANIVYKTGHNNLPYSIPYSNAGISIGLHFK